MDELVGKTIAKVTMEGFEVTVTFTDGSVLKFDGWTADFTEGSSACMAVTGRR